MRHLPRPASVVHQAGRAGKPARPGRAARKLASRAMRTLLALPMLAAPLVGFETASAAPSAAMVRVSVANDGSQANDFSTAWSLSDDGRFVAFESPASNLVVGDVNGFTDVFVRDRLLGTTELVSVSANGGPADWDSQGPALSADGRYVVYYSSATNLVPDDTNGYIDVFVRDRELGVTTRVSVASDGTQGNRESIGRGISGEGRFVAFMSWADNLVAGDTNVTLDVFVHDVQTGTTKRVSVASDGTQANGYTGGDAISSDGRFVGFCSEQATNLVPGDTNGRPDIFVHDQQTGTTERVSVASDGTQGNHDSCGDPVISGDGRYVAFGSLASNLVPGDANGATDVFVRDRASGATSRVSVGSPQYPFGNYAQGLSNDGAYVLVIATTWSPEAGHAISDVFRHDRRTGENTRINVRYNSQWFPEAGGRAAMSSDGRYIAFNSSDPYVVPGDTNGLGDAFVRILEPTDATSVTPSALATGSSDGAVMIRGSGFAATPAVSAGSEITITSVAFMSPSELRANLSISPNASLGPRDLVVTNPSGDVTTCNGCLVIITTPAAPTGVASTRGNGAVTVLWTPPTDDGFSSITSYTVTAFAGANAVASRTTDGGTTSTAVSGLTNGTTYTFRVTAANAAGAGPASAASNAVTPATVPSVPTSVAATRANSSALVSWQPPSNDGGNAVTSYRVSAYMGSTGISSVSVPATQSTVTVTGLANGMSYTFKVAAANGVGNGPESLSSNNVVPATVPGAPTQVGALADDRAATIFWSAPADDGGSGVLFYTVTAYRGVTAVTSVTVSASGDAAFVPGLTNGLVYTFRVTAANDVGVGPISAPSNGVTPTLAPAPIGPPDASPGSGYWMITSEGAVYAFGDAVNHGGVANTSAADIESTPSGSGYWILSTKGDVFTNGDAAHFGGTELMEGEQATSLSATNSGAGYWIFTNKGRVVARGDAQHYGDMSAVPLNGPVLDSVATPSGQGYWMVASDGGIFSFGDAKFHGSMGGEPLNKPVISMAPDPDGSGYWLVASDGGIFAFDAPFYGSMGGTRLNKPISGMVTGPAGYLMVAEDGGIFAFGDVKFYGSLGSNPPASPVVAVALVS